MSGADSSQGPGWWQASDGKWYPPEQKPGAAPSTPASSPPASSPASGPPATSAMPAASPVPGSDSGEGGFFSRLFDMSFNRFVTPSLIKVLFILAIIIISLVAVFMLIGGAASAGDGGIFLVILAPIYWLLGIIYVRVFLELAIVFFRIEINTRPKD
jgi:hypothetical protein